MAVLVEFNPKLKVDLLKTESLRSPGTFGFVLLVPDLEKQRVFLVFSKIIKATKVELFPLLF